MTTAAAQAPAPGKLEFKDDYTPDEAERVIRNSKGLPVGVRPKMVWTWKKALLWAAIAIVCACGWAILAGSRGGAELLRHRLTLISLLHTDQDHAHRRRERHPGRARA